MNKKSLVILGSNAAREVFYVISQDSKYQNTDFYFVDDVTNENKLVLKNQEYPIIKDWNFSHLDNPTFLVGIGNPEHKKIMVKKALEAGLIPEPTYVHPRVTVFDLDVGVGGIICENSIISCNVKIGNYVVLSYSTCVGHDVYIGDYVSMNPNCCISGNVKIDEGCVLGTGSIIREKIHIGKNVMTGLGTVVVSDLEENSVYAGVPAKKIR